MTSASGTSVSRRGFGRRVAVAALVLAGLPACRTDAPPDRPPQAAHQREGAGEAAVLLGQADMAFLEARLDDAQPMYSAAAALAGKEGDVSTQVEALAQAGRMFALQGELEDGRPWLDRAVELARPEQPLAWSRTLLARGVFAREEGRLDEASSLFRQAFEYCSAQQLDDRTLQAAFLLASSGDRERRIEWTRAGIEFAADVQLVGWQSPLYMNLGTLYMESEEYSRAVSAFEAARVALAPTGDLESRMLADFAYGRALRLAGRLPEARRAMSTAHASSQERLTELRNKDRMGWVGKTLYELAEIDLAEGEDERGIERLREALAKLELAGVPKRDPERWDELTARLAAVEAGEVEP